MKSHVILSTALTFLSLTLMTAGGAYATPVFFGPTPYLSEADIPTNFYAGNAPTSLENFEDGSLDFGIIADVGGLKSLSFGINPSAGDSVDADDGIIDGNGLNGDNWLVRNPPNELGLGVTFSFSQPVTAAGLVWTDGPENAQVTLEAFGIGMVSLGVSGPFTLGDDNFFGTTIDDRFLGVQDLTGILAIRVSNGPGDFGGIEVDHVQFGSAMSVVPAVPAPATLALMGLGLAGIGYQRRRSKKAA